MKHVSFSRLCGGLFLLFIACNLQAQQTGIKTLPNVTVTSTASVNKKVSDAFQASFKNAVSPVWYRLDKDYLVEFITGDMNNRALFRRNGALVYEISYGHESNLPKEVRHLVKSNYVDFNIMQAINIKENNRNIWVINLEDDKQFIIARVEEGALEEVSNYDRNL